VDIRWRLAVLGLQLIVLTLATKAVTGAFGSEAPWFIAGLFSVVVNPHLIEHPFVRQVHVIANVILFLFLYWLGHDSATQIGWNIAAGICSLIAALAIFGITVSKQNARLAGGARAARQLAEWGSGDVVFSMVFFLDLPNHYTMNGGQFWVLTFVWLALLILGHTDWHRMWVSISVRDPGCMVETLIGPSVLTVIGNELPEQGTRVKLTSKTAKATGLVVRRILRKGDMWAQLFINDPEACRDFLADIAMEVTEDSAENGVVGSVEEGSTDTRLRFIATRALEVGNVVAIPMVGTEDKIIYQLTTAAIEHTDVKGGAHLFVRANAVQIGRFLAQPQTFRRHLWVPSPGAPVLSGQQHLPVVAAAPPNQNWEKLGTVIGTTLPVYIDLATMSDGHLAILGMTKMGKSTLAARLADRLSATRAVLIFDLTGEYIGKRGLPAYTGQQQLSSAGISVWEPAAGAVPANQLRTFLRKTLDELAIPEYQGGIPFPRTFIIDEAHQFIPEPAGIGFQAPGRDASYEIGLLLMQIRKFGISIILISQRTAVVAKSALSQCENLIAFKSVDQTALDYLEAVAGEDVRLLLPRLQQRQALAFGPSISSDSPVGVHIA
jgi:uncharacterized protein DUF87